jgi:hypothetical protein
METRQIAIQYQHTDVWNKSLKQIDETLKIISCLFRALGEYDHREFIPLAMDGIPLTIGGVEDEGNEKLIGKEEVLSWVYRKAFEEYIIGLTESLIAAYRLFEVVKLADETARSPIEYNLIEGVLDKITTKAHKLHFPVLIEEIEKHIGTTLKFKSEVLSINSVRNCLVHRNGMVSNKDLNGNERLTLFYRDLAMYVETLDGIKELTVKFKDSNEPVYSIAVQPLLKELSFELGAKVQIEANIFNGLAWTCFQFIQDLYQHCPGSNGE